MAIPVELVNKLQPYTKSTPVRMGSMYQALVAVDDDEIPGDVVECGVWRGGNIMMTRIVSPSRVCWLYDTFEGMTEPDHEFDYKRPDKDGRVGEKAIERYRAKQRGGTKWDAAGLEEVQRSFGEQNLLDLTNWVVGDVAETLPNTPGPKSISILRLDLDWYWPTRQALEHLYPRLSSGGFLIIDDYGHWMGCKRAVDDYFAAHTSWVVDAMIQVDYSCVVIRKC